jgi:hypothetical protein
MSLCVNRRRATWIPISLDIREQEQVVSFLAAGERKHFLIGGPGAEKKALGAETGDGGGRRPIKRLPPHVADSTGGDHVIDRGAV